MTVAKPLPCPWCGEEPIKWFPEGSDRCAMSCINAVCQFRPTPLFTDDTYDDAVHRWNDRKAKT
jgi:hypothetical protein